MNTCKRFSEPEICMLGSKCNICREIKIKQKKGMKVTNNLFGNPTFHAKGVICKFNEKCINPFCKFSHSTIRGTSPSNPLSNFKIPEKISKDSCVIFLDNGGRKLNENHLRYISLILRCKDANESYMEFIGTPSRDELNQLQNDGYVAIIYRSGKKLLVVKSSFMTDINFFNLVRDSPNINCYECQYELDIEFNKHLSGLMIPKSNIKVHGALALIIFQIAYRNNANNNKGELLAVLNFSNGNFIKIKNDLLLLKLVYFYQNMKCKFIKSDSDTHFVSLSNKVDLQSYRNVRDCDNFEAIEFD